MLKTKIFYEIKLDKNIFNDIILIVLRRTNEFEGGEKEWQCRNFYRKLALR